VFTSPYAPVEISESGVSEPGELLVRGPNVMRCYLNNENATRATIDADGFLHTGDIAMVSALGEVTIVERSKELIKYKGYQIAPAEIGAGSADADEFPVHEFAGTVASEFAPEAASFHSAER